MFFPFGFLSAVLITWFPPFCLPSHQFVLLHDSLCSSGPSTQLASLQMNFLVFSWLLLIFSSSFLESSALPFIPALFLHIRFLIPSEFSLSHFWTLCLLDCRGFVSLFIPSGEFSCSFNWEWFLSFYILLIVFLFCEFRENHYCGLRGLFIYYYFFVFLPCLGLFPQHMEVPRLGV